MPKNTQKTTLCFSGKDGTGPSLHVPVSQIGESQDTAIKSVLFFIKSVCFSPAGGAAFYYSVFYLPLFSVFCFPPPCSSSLPVCLLLYLHFYKLLNWPICSSGSSLRVAGFRPRVHLSISRSWSKRNLRSSVSISQYLHAYLVHRLMLIFQRYMCKYRLDFHRYSTLEIHNLHVYLLHRLMGGGTA